MKQAPKPSTAPPSPTSGRSVGSGLPGVNSSKTPQSGIAKSSKSVTHPVPAASSSTIRQKESTASNLAALWPTSIPRSIDPSIDKWRERHRDLVKQTQKEERLVGPSRENYEYKWKEKETTLDKGKEKEKEMSLDKGKGKGKEKESTSLTPDYFGDASDGGISSSAGPIRNVGAGSTNRNMAGLSASGFGPEPRRASLAESTLARRTMQKDGMVQHWTGVRC